LFNRQELDIYMPIKEKGGERAGPPLSGLPTVVFFHGGSWMHGDKDDIRVIDRFLDKMRREGWAVASVNYVTSPIRLLEGPSRNVRSALSWLKKNGLEYGLDPRNMGIYSVSAGSHLVMEALVASDRPEEEWRFWLNEYGPVNLLKMADGDAFDSSERLSRFPTAYLRKHSPLLDVTKPFPPTAIVHGNADRTVALSQSERLAERLAGVGTEVSLKIIPGGDHGFFNKSQDDWMEMEDEFIIFMRRHFH
ncbi:MAG: alpha/beta hydrolase, partial [Spirochaetaceae bacterium]|nr:alpha/beta hydrolase [Spirochaetaceae bacterium]